MHSANSLACVCFQRERAAEPSGEPFSGIFLLKDGCGIDHQGPGGSRGSNISGHWSVFVVWRCLHLSWAVRFGGMACDSLITLITAMLLCFSMG